MCGYDYINQMLKQPFEWIRKRFWKLQFKKKALKSPYHWFQKQPPEVFLEVSQNLRENTCARVSRLQFIKKESLSQVFSCEHLLLLLATKNTSFTEHLWTTASMIYLYCCNVRTTVFNQELGGNRVQSWMREKGDSIRSHISYRHLIFWYI